ncbi:MAG: late competence development ComFB family protein [Huintestinicola sp.]
MSIINMAEEITRLRMDDLLKDYDCCKCGQCYDDMLAMALNNIKPQYVNSYKGALFSRINSTRMQISTDIDVAVIKAIERVSSQPHHITDDEVE